jgi:uncharacterized membrane protein
MNPKMSEDVGNGDVDLTPPKGLPAGEFMVETWREAARAKKAAMTAANASGEALHAVGELTAEVARLSEKLDELRSDLRRATDRPPPMRAELASGIDLRALEEKAVEAVKEGIESPTKTPVDEVRRIFAEEENKREVAREFARLKKVEADAKAEEERKASDAKAHTAQRKADRRKLAIGIAIAIGGAGGWKAVEFLIAHIH